MKTITNHLGAILTTLVAVACCIAIVSVSAPSISGFFGDTVIAKQTEKAEAMLFSIRAPGATTELEPDYDPDATHEAPTAGDVYETSDYIYRYQWLDSSVTASFDPDCAMDDMGWSVLAKEDKSEYEPIYDSIYGAPVTHMYYTFDYCTKLTTAPAVPKYATSMAFAYSNTSLTAAPELPEGVTDLGYTFAGTSITTTPKIPSSVNNMQNTFEGCRKLESAGAIPENVVNMQAAFNNCSALTAMPDMSNATSVMYMTSAFAGCSALIDASSTVIPASVMTMESAFENCTTLTAAPDLSNAENLSNMFFAFYSCGSLTGEVTIPASVSDMSFCFNGTVKPITMKYYTSCTAAGNYVAPGNVTKSAIN